MKAMILSLVTVLSLAFGVTAFAADPAYVKVAELDGRQTVAIADYCGVGNDGFVRVVRVANSGVETWVYCAVN